MPHVGVDIDEVIRELGRIRDCIEAARALAEPHVIGKYDSEDLRECCEVLLVNTRYFMIQPLMDYLDSCWRDEESDKPADANSN